MKPPVILRIFRNNQLVEVKQFDLDQIIIGREGEVSLALSDENVAAIHCMIELRDSGYYACDLGSSTGTFKNGKQILDEALSSGDQIGIGPFLIHFFVGAPKPKSPPAPTPSAGEPKAPANVPSEPVARVPKAVPPTVSPTIPVAGPVAPSAPASKSTPTPPKLPEVGKVMSGATGKPGPISYRKKKGQKTFAPPSPFADLREYLKPQKGNVVEVVVAWKERIIGVYHFSDKKSATLGSTPGSDIPLPSAQFTGQVGFLDLSSGCRTFVPKGLNIEMHSGEKQLAEEDLIRLGKAQKQAAGVLVKVDQAEMLWLSIPASDINIVVRWVQGAGTPLLAGPLDMSAGELTGLIISFLLVSLFGLYMSVYTPRQEEEQKEDQLRLAQFVYNKKEEVKTEPPPQPTPAPTPAPTPSLTPTPAPKKVEVTEKKQEQKGKQQSVAARQEVAQSKAAEVRPMPTKVDRPKKFTSTKQGGAVKMGEKAGANAQSAKDVTKEGLLSAFGGGGVRKELDKAYSGGGELLGMADKATGASGQNESRGGNDIGSKFKDAGAGGKGTATQGISGIGTKGRDSGQAWEGSSGLGGKGKVSIDVGGADAGFSGTIDREAVRRVIRSILNQIKSCYERQLRTHSELEGKIVINFEIHDQGRVQKSEPKEASGDMRVVAECVAARIKEQRFPDPPAGSFASVDYPFVFGKQ